MAAGAMRARGLVVRVHRYAGLALLLFLLLEGLTGSALAIYTPLERLITPGLFAPPHPGMRRLSPGELAVRAERIVPAGRVSYLYVDGGRANARMEARDAARPLDFTNLFLDPCTGTELGRRRDGDLSQGRINLLPFVARLHRDLALGETGGQILGVAALAWTIDCFYALYLALPRGGARFWRRLGAAFLIKPARNAFRLNYDLHRSFSLWFWLLFFVFAWSSVMLELPVTYRAAMDLVSARQPLDRLVTLHPTHREYAPRLSWLEAEAQAERLMAEVARNEHVKLGARLGIGYQPEIGVYDNAVRSDADIRRDGWNTGIWWDGDSGALQSVQLPRRGLPGDRIDAWLWALHYGDVLGSGLYRWLVCVFGLVVCAVCGSGFYVWLRKLRARRGRRDSSFSEEKEAKRLLFVLSRTHDLGPLR